MASQSIVREQIWSLYIPKGQIGPLAWQTYQVFIITWKDVVHIDFHRARNTLHMTFSLTKNEIMMMTILF